MGCLSWTREWTHGGDNSTHRRDAAPPTHKAAITPASITGCSPPRPRGRHDQQHPISNIPGAPLLRLGGPPRVTQLAQHASLRLQRLAVAFSINFRAPPSSTWGVVTTLRFCLFALHCGCGGLRLRFPSTSGRPPPLIGGYSRRYASASSRFTAAAADCGGDHHERSPFPVFTWLGRLHIFICCLLSLPSLGLGDSTSSPSWVASFLCKLPQHLRLRQLLLRQSQQL